MCCYIVLLHFFTRRGRSAMLTSYSDQIVRRVTVHGSVIVPCPNFRAQAMTFKLFKGSTVIASKSTENAQKMTEEKISLRMNMENKTCFVLNNVTMDQTGLYTCEADKTYPPPMVKVVEKPQAIVIVDGEQCFVLFTLGFQFRLRRKDFTRHDYINMKPIVRRKKQRILHPPRLSWYRDPATSTMSCNKHPSTRATH
uniref:Immunoglobulin subtype domain-containing protein n=1 Tax=Electrophorus electricus TaxID=8005 RepID=A0A4W4FIG0_ELEEL